MAKRKVTVTIDEEVLLALRRMSVTNVSATVNEALRGYLEESKEPDGPDLLEHWLKLYGPTSEADRVWACEAIAELDGELDRNDATSRVA